MGGIRGKKHRKIDEECVSQVHQEDSVQLRKESITLTSQQKLLKMKHRRKENE